jgi:hypothetical protein
MSAALFVAFRKLVAQDPIRILLCAISRSNDVIDMKESAKLIRATTASTLHEVEYHSVIGWLYQVYYTDLERAIPYEWWYVYHRHVEDLLVIGTVIAGDRLRRLHASLPIENMPLCLLGLPLRLKLARISIQETKRKVVAQADEKYVQLFMQAPPSD